MKWSFFPEVSESGELIKASGEYRFNDCIFHFRVRRTPYGRYPYEVHVRLESPETGKTLQVGGDRRRKKKKTFTPEEKKQFEGGKQVEKLNATTIVYMDLYSEAKVKEAVKKGANRLYVNNYDVINREIKRTVSMGSIHALAMYHAFQKEFFLAHYTNNKTSTRKEKQKFLETICAGLDNRPVNELIMGDLHTVYLTLPKSKARGLYSVAEKFFEFCRGKAYVGTNPVTNYLEDLEEKNDPVLPGGDKAEKIHRIDQEKEEILQRRTSEKIGTPLAMAIVLAKDGGLDAKEIQELKWGDILINGTGIDRTVRIRNFHTDYTGGTKNYTRPLLSVGRQLLLAQYDILCGKYTVGALKKMYVVPDCNNPKKQASQNAITAHIKSELLHSGITYETIALCGKKKDKRPGGAGMVLCHEHYVHMLEEHCGFEPSSAEMAFMTGKRIDQITDDYYVSYIGADGERRLEGAVRRDSRFAPKPISTEPIIEQKISDNEVEKVICAAGAEKLTGCIGKIVIPPGGQLYICSEYGLQGDIKVRIPDCDDSEAVTFEY